MTSVSDTQRGLDQVLTAQPLLLCVGDSYTYGDGVAASQAWPHFLGQMLPEYQVVNAGIRGANLTMMQKALEHYQQRKNATHILITILDIDILRLSGQLQDEEFFMDEKNYSEELERNCQLLANMLQQSKQAGSTVSVTLWGRDTFITRFQKLSRRLEQVCSDCGVPFRNDIASFMSVLSYRKFSVSPDNGHPGENAHKLIASHMFNIFRADQRDPVHAD